MFCMCNLVVLGVALGIGMLMALWFKERRSKGVRRVKPARTMFVLGSGGHTSELLKIVKNMDFQKYSPRCYIHAGSDNLSKHRALEIEGENTDFVIQEIYRSRSLHQSYFSSIFSTLRATLQSVPIVFTFKPDVIICNGPGTCVPVCFVIFFLSFLPWRSRCKIVFVESFCRVTSISLTGKILQLISDLFVVQWPGLEQTGKAKYVGRIF
ncbi:UDP-N-acetylglucosamine transferase subunit alg14 [Sergentomyia squamirostris]